jgi:hypothetical protein
MGFTPTNECLHTSDILTININRAKAHGVENRHESQTKSRRQAIRVFFSTGIHGKNDMPEDVLPHSIKRGSLEHLLFITLTVSIDYQRDAEAL